MPCTTILVGKKASSDGSTMIARNDDGNFDVKKLVVVTPDKQPKKYKSVIGHLTVELDEEPLSYTATPTVYPDDEGIWAAAGINEKNVAMSATETITTNPRVLGADPMVRYQKAKSKKEKDIPGGIGEEDLVVLVLPYIRTARQGVLRLGKLLEKYGTYEPNGIAFSDKDEIWWLETIGGHHWMARRVKDDECVIMPNQLGLDRFDFDDAFGKQEENLCSSDLREFIAENHLDLSNGQDFNPRWCFGSHADSDHVYNTPRAWYMGRYLNPTKYKWDGENADYKPESDDIPWSFVPEHKVTVEDVKYLLSSHFQGTPYDPYSKNGSHPYRTICKNNTGTMAICQIRPDMPEEIRAIEWICFGSTAFDTVMPVYTNVKKLPDYLSKVEKKVTTDNFYWNSQLINALVDPYYASAVIYVERYENVVMAKTRALLKEYDAKFKESGDLKVLDDANRKLCEAVGEETSKTLGQVLSNALHHMKNSYNRGDN